MVFLIKIIVLLAIVTSVNYAYFSHLSTKDYLVKKANCLTKSEISCRLLGLYNLSDELVKKY